MNFIKSKIKAVTDNAKPDYILLFLVSSLIITSVIFSYSLSIYTVDYFDYNQFHFFLRQLFSGCIAILFMWLFAHIKPDFIIPKMGWILFGLFFFLMLIMHFLPSSMVTQSGGAARWIRLPGFSLSPVEFFKIGFIYFLANSFDRILMDHGKLPFLDEVKLILPYLIIFLIVVFLVAVLQKDLGQVMLLGSILVVMLMFANRSWKIFASLFGSVIVGFITLVAIAPHRINRIQSWWSSVQDSMLSLPFVPEFIANALRVREFPEPYQVSHSLNAINHGAINGVGLGEGGLKLGFLSEVHTDFILAGIAEETGLIGIITIVTILFLILHRIFKISRKIQNTKYHLFTLGIGLMIVFAFLINSYGISGIIPIKGIAVPFLSYGGSSMIASGIAIGLVLSISKQIPKKEKD
jgi:cell division protein FtsW